MPDELIPTETPPVETLPVETPPVETPPPPDPNLYDDRGVSWRNVASENQRKLQEAAERERQYQARLGAHYQQPPAAPAQPDADDLETFVSQFDPNVQKALRGMAQVLEGRAEKKARSVGYDLITQLTHQQEVQQPEMLEEARRQRAILDSNPLWANAPETLRNDRAIAEAKLIMAKKAPAAPAPAARPAGAPPPPALPGTRPAAPAGANDREKFIQAHISDPDNLGFFSVLYKGIDPNSTEGIAKRRKVAERAYSQDPADMWGGQTGKMIEAMRESLKRRV